MSHLCNRYKGEIVAKEVNFQNFPAGHEIRNVIVAPDGHLIVAFDYSSLEARLIAMATRDSEFCSDIWNGIDTHMKWTERLIELYPAISNKMEKKELRQFLKSNLVFGSFYGSKKESVIKRLGELEVPPRVASQIYDEFWDTYKEAKKRQKYLLDYYNSRGVVKNLNGRERRGVLSVNKITNYPIQSSASYDICLRAGDRLSRLAYELDKPQYQYIINIHDDLTFYIPLDTLDEDIQFIAKELVYPAYHWVIVPLEVECKAGKSWGSLEVLGKFSTLDWWEWKDNKWVKKEDVECRQP